MGILKGTIFITDDIEKIYQIPLNGTNKIVSLDEDDVLDINNPNIIGGTCLLPPMEAKIAEADGNEVIYDTVYSNHLLSPFQQQFISALVAFLYKGGNLILFLPEIGYTSTLSKLVDHLFKIYGIHVGVINHQNPMVANCYYDDRCIPMWLNMIFTANVISAREYLFMYPADAIITNETVLRKLLDSMKPYGETMKDQRNYILRFHKLIHKNPNVIQAIERI